MELLRSHAGDRKNRDNREMSMFGQESLLTPRRMLRRREAAQYVRDRWGVPCAEKTLAKLAVTGAGPLFRRSGRVPLYETGALDDWVRSKLAQPVKSTSEYVRTTSARRPGDDK